MAFTATSVRIGRARTASRRSAAGEHVALCVASIVVGAFVPSVRFVVLAALVIALLAAWRFRFLLWPVAACFRPR